MSTGMTSIGLPGIGDVPWGSHFCQFYNTAQELADVLVPFFKAGLENNEQCILIASQPLPADAAREALRSAMPDFDERLRAGQIEILDFDQWYVRDGVHDYDAVLNDWIARKERALALGYAGLRLSGNTCWLEAREQWRNFADYEAKVNACFHEHRIVGMCSYHLGRCTGADAIDVIRNHQFAITCDSGTWAVLESEPLKRAREELRQANRTLERRVAHRTARLRDNERWLRDMLGALPAAVYTTDAAGRVTYYNQAAIDLAGRRPTLGRDEWCVTWRLFWPDGRPMPHDTCPMAVALKEDRLVHGAEAVAERPDGTRVSFLAYPTPLRDGAGKLIGAVNMLVDITERKRAEALADSQRQALQMLGEGAPLEDVLAFLLSIAERYAADGMLGSILLLNEKGTHFLPGIGPSLPAEFNAAVAGVPVSSGLGVCCHAVSRREAVVVPDFSADPLWAPFAAFLAPFGLRAGWSSPIIGSDDRVLGTFANYYRHPGNPTPPDLQWVELVKRTAAIAIERTQSEEALLDSKERLRRLNQELEARVREEVAAREATQARLAHVQRMEALGQLAGGIAHDFNNVVQAVLGGAALIERRPDDTERVRGLAHRIMEASERGSAVTRRLLAFARRGDLRAEPVDVVLVLKEMREILSHTLGTGINVRLEAIADLPPAFVDKAQLETALVNLATNARDAMEAMGTLTLCAGIEAVRDNDAVPRLIALKPGSYVRLSVRDTGPGMTPEVLARASEPFFTTKAAGQGTGLGLAMARGFAEQSGGGLSIESTRNCGTVVRLWFPVARDVSPVTTEDDDTGLATGEETRARLLLVDDYEIVRETLAQELEAEGYAVLPAASGVEALSLLDAGETVDLIISDLSMQGMDGVSLIREAQRRRPNLPAILLTGFVMTSGNALEAAVNGALTLLTKPVQAKTLAERVAVLLESTAAER